MNVLKIMNLLVSLILGALIINSIDESGDNDSKMTNDEVLSHETISKLIH